MLCENSKRMDYATKIYNKINSFCAPLKVDVCCCNKDNSIMNANAQIMVGTHDEVYKYLSINNTNC